MLDAYDLSDNVLTIMIKTRRSISLSYTIKACEVKSGNLISFWIQYHPRRRSWPDFVWSLSLPRIAISFDHMHPLSSVHFFFIQLILVILD